MCCVARQVNDLPIKNKAFEPIYTYLPVMFFIVRYLISTSGILFVCFCCILLTELVYLYALPNDLTTDSRARCSPIRCGDYLSIMSVFEEQRHYSINFRIQHFGLSIFSLLTEVACISTVKCN